MTSRRRSTSTTPALSFAAPLPALVTIRQYSPESLMWQTVSVKGHVAGESAENIQGPMRKPLAGLVDFLRGLMFTYCC